MNRRELVLATIGVLLLPAAFAFELLANLYVTRSSTGLLATRACTVLFTRYEHTSDPIEASAVVIHGLSANRKLMEPLAERLGRNRIRAYAIDMPGHGDSNEPFSFERAEQCAAEFIEAVAARGDVDPNRLVVVGHSTGGGIAIRLADRIDARATVALSPAPLTPQPGPLEHATPFRLPPRLPRNLLVFIAQLDPYPIRDSAKEWVAQAGGVRDSDDAFDDGNALHLTDVRWATHTSVLIDAQVARDTIAWIRRAARLPGEPWVPRAPMAHIVALLGIVLLFPAFASVTVRLLKVHGPATQEVPVDVATAGETRMPRSAYVVWLGASLVAALLLYFWIPLRALRMFNGDYFASFLLIVGFIGAAWFWKQRPEAQPRTLTARAVLAGLVIGATITAAGAAILTWKATDIWLNDARWMRFPFLLLAMLPYALAEEWALGAPRTGAADVWRRVLRALALRGILWAAMILAFFILHSTQVLIPLLTVYLVLVSVAQRLGADAIRRRSGSAAAAAVFSAILAAWFIAAVFPLT